MDTDTWELRNTLENQVNNTAQAYCNCLFFYTAGMNTHHLLHGSNNLASGKTNTVALVPTFKAYFTSIRTQPLKVMIVQLKWNTHSATNTTRIDKTNSRTSPSHLDHGTLAPLYFHSASLLSMVPVSVSFVWSSLDDRLKLPYLLAASLLSMVSV